MPNFIKIMTYYKAKLWNILSYPSHLQFHLFLEMCQCSLDIYTPLKMKIRKMNKWSLGILCLLMFSFMACDPGLEHDLPSEAPSPVLQMDPEERALIVTNDVFAAVIDNQNQETIEEILKTVGNDLSSLNEKGDSPFGTAIQFRRKELALFLLEKLQCADLYHQNNKGESYIYLSAQHGYHELIQLIANKCFERKKTWTTLDDYEFSDLDPETLEGERAIHAAYNSTVMEALHTEYWRGIGEFPWRAFYQTNNQEKTFLHTAVKDGRNSVVEWGIQNFCHENSWEKSDHFYQNIPASTLRHAWHFVQNYLQTIDLPLNFTQLINFQDEEDNTALHLAAQRPLNLEAIRLISNCRWTDYNLDNTSENTALQEFLKALDPAMSNHEEEIKKTFMFLIHQETYLKQWFTHITKRVNHQNTEGDSSLHIAARLADEFFYNELKKFGDIYLTNKKKQTPEAIFKATRTQLQGGNQP